MVFAHGLPTLPATDIIFPNHFVHPVSPGVPSDKEVGIGVEAVEEVEGERPSKRSLEGVAHRRVTKSGREQFGSKNGKYS